MNRLRCAAQAIVLAAVLLFTGLRAPSASAQDSGLSAPRFGRVEIALPSVRVAAGANVYLPYAADLYGRGEGVTVNALLTAPDGRTMTAPCFYMERMAPAGDTFTPTGEAGFYLRFAPDQAGAWSGRVSVTDREGTKDGGPISFSCTSTAAGKGFVSISAKDPRYLQFSDGTTLANGPGYHVNSPAKIAGMPAGTVVRAWWNGTGATYSPWDIGGQGRRINWGNLHTPNIHPAGDKHLSVIQKAGGSLIELLAMRGKKGAKYRWTATLKTEGVTGPVSTSDAKLGSNYGPAMWLTDNAAGTDKPVNTQWLHGSNGWTTIGGDFTLTSTDGTFRWVKMGLKNCTAGTSYWASASLREVLSGGGLGPELLELPNGVNVHKWYSQAAAYRADTALGAAAKAGAFLKIIFFEKASNVWGRWQPDGEWQDSWEQNNANFYGPTDPDQMTFTRWHQKAAVRYFMARYGWSPNLLQAEFCNEGDPFSGNHSAGTQFFTREIRSYRNRPTSLLGGTSNWHSLPSWMKDPARGDMADVHSYPATLDMNIAGGNAAYDTALLHVLAYTRFTPGLKMPFGWGEISIHQQGYASKGDSWRDAADDPNVPKDKEGTWLHKATWSGLGPSGAYLFWWYMDQIEAYDLYRIGDAFLRFSNGIDLAGGGYVDAAPLVGGTLRSTGQKNPAKGRAHLWIDNPAHTYQAVVTGASIPSAAGTVAINGMPSGNYRAEWWDTSLGSVIRADEVSAPNGQIVLRIDSLARDVAVKLVLDGQAPDPDPTPQPSPAPTVYAPPSAVKAVPTGTTVAGSWTAPVSAERPSSYKLYLDGVLKGTSTATGASLTGIAVGTHRLGVSAVYAGGESARVEVEFTITAATFAAPTGVQAAVTGTTVAGSWTAPVSVEKPTSYKLYVDGVLKGTSTGTSGSLAGIVAGTHRLGVSAIYAGGESARAEVAFTVVQPTFAAPTNVKATVSGTTVTGSWTAPVSAEKPASYKLYVDGVLKATVAGTSTSASLTGIAAGTHRLGVSAVYSGGASARVEVAFTVAATTLAAPTSPVAQIQLTLVKTAWKAPVAPATPVLHYQVYVDGVFKLKTTATNASISGVSRGTHTFGVSAVYASGESAKATASFTKP